MITDENRQKMINGIRKKGSWNKGIKMKKGYEHCGFQKGNKLCLGRKNALGNTFKHSEESKEKQRIARKNRKGYVHILTPKRLAHIQIMVKKRMGIEITEEHKLEILKSCEEKLIKETEKRNKRLKAQREYYLRNKEKIKKYKKEYKEKYNEKYNLYQKSRSNKKRGNGGSFTVNEWLKLKEMFNFTCLCCNKKEPEIKLTADHIIPVSKGGKSFIENIQPLCISCNSKKSTSIINYKDLNYDPNI